MFSGIKLKKTLPAAAVMLCFLFSQAAWAGTIIGSPHDFRGYPWNRGRELCLNCHLPQKTETMPGPLWNRELSTQAFIMYGKTHFLTPGAVMNNQPEGISKKCLSCHDGIIAPDSYGGNTGGIAYRFDKDFMGTIPNNNHPISFIYDTALATKYKDLYDPSTRLSGVTGSTATVKADMLFADRMECSSCHDVHNIKAVPETKLLVIDSAGSALCLTCHNK